MNGSHPYHSTARSSCQEGRRLFVPKKTHRLAPPPNWTGFSAPRYTQIPDQFFDLWLPVLLEGELRVLLYIMRRTFGFKKEEDAISLSQITDGIMRRDGTVLDY